MQTCLRKFRTTHSTQKRKPRDALSTFPGRNAQRQASPCTYGMRRKTVRKTEYLFRDKDRHGNGNSLGRRSPETEKLLEAFTQGRTTA